MGILAKWRILHGVDAELHDKLVDDFNRAYEASSKPEGMAMYAHHDSFGSLMGVSISAESIPYCPFSAGWSETETPNEFGNLNWVAGDPSLR